MADIDSESKMSSQPESNNFEHDFEQLDPYAAPPSQDDAVSSSAFVPEAAEEDLYTGSEAESAKLISLDEEPHVPEPSQPESSVRETSPQKSTSAKEVSTGKCEWIQNVDPRVINLVYWRDPKKSGIAFASMLLLLVSLAMFSVLSVVAYLSLAALTVTISFRVYKNVLQAVQKTSEGHPFKQYLDVDVELSSDKVHQAADILAKRLTCTVRELRRLFLVQDLVDSVKFGLLLWVMTYIGAWFNGMTLVILSVVGIFTLPKVYETYQVQIDQHLDVVQSRIRNTIKQVQEKIPMPGKKKTQ